MSDHRERIGNFNCVTPALCVGILCAIASLGGIVWSWNAWQSGDVSPLIPCGMSVVGGAAFLSCMVWIGKQHVIWVEVGDDLAFATLVDRHTVKWSDVEGIEISSDDVVIPLLPLQIVGPGITIAHGWLADITLKSGRELRGRVSQQDVSVLVAVVTKNPRLDAEVSRALASPRAAMTTFVDSVMEEQMHYATMFLDLSALPQNDEQLASRCAMKLKDVIDSLWFIDFDEIPDDEDCASPYVLASNSDQDLAHDLRPVADAIRLVRDKSSGWWRFDADTVSMIVNEFLVDSTDE